MIINGKSITSEYITDSVVLGDGVFETLRTYHNQVFALERHLRRMAFGLEQIGVSEFDQTAINNSVNQILRDEPLESGALRISLYSDGTQILSHKPYKPSGEGLSCFTTDLEARASTYKSASYSERISLRRIAAKKGFDDAILVNSDGQVSELSTSNLLIRIANKWLTPSIESGCLPGVTRSFLVENFGVMEERLTRKDLEQASVAAALSSLREIQEIKAIDGKNFPSSMELRELQESFSSWILGNLLS